MDSNKIYSFLKSSSKKDELGWMNVLYSFGFLLVPITLSLALQLGISTDLMISGSRCVLQLTLMGSVLNEVLGTENPVYVLFMALLLTLLASLELVFSKTKRQFAFMFPFIFLSLVSSTLIIATCGQIFALRHSPFWKPVNFIPTSGMLIGNAMSAIAVGINFCLKELTENSSTIDTYLAMGASRSEAFKPILAQALKVALLPTINTMSITGLISIPGMMTGQILGGTSVSDAVKYQSIILFMITSSSSLAVVFSCLFLFSSCLDKKHRLRADRIFEREPWSLPNFKLFFSAVFNKLWFNRAQSQNSYSDATAPNSTTRLLSNSDNNTRSYVAIN